MSDSGHPSDRMLPHEIERSGQRVQAMGCEIIESTDILFPPIAVPEGDIPLLLPYTYQLLPNPQPWRTASRVSSAEAMLTYNVLIDDGDLAGRALRIFLKQGREVRRIEEQRTDVSVRWYAAFERGEFTSFVATDRRSPRKGVSRTQITILERVMNGVLGALRHDRQQ